MNVGIYLLSEFDTRRRIREIDTEFSTFCKLKHSKHLWRPNDAVKFVVEANFVALT